jgi:predicted AAA+ superfamily ATPase
MNLKHRLGDWALGDPLFPNHMSFILGPRQCGKTTMALNYLHSLGQKKEDCYFNWDRGDVRRRFKNDIDWMSALKKTGKRPLLVFDEIHKVRNWKRILKGIYDQYRDDFQFVITGSGRLDHFQRGGDSLAGRYDPYFLQPFTPGEILGLGASNKLSMTALLDSTPIDGELIEHWEETGGFPEPFLSSSQARARAWWRQYLIRVTEEDLRDLTRLESVDLMRDIISLLPSKVSAPLSYNSIREDVESSFATVKRYINTLGQLFMIFSIQPYSNKIHRAIRKEEKFYFYHFPVVENVGARFENEVALVLRRWVFEMNEKAQGEWGLHYIRDQDGREVDFLLTQNKRPFFLFETKYSETKISPSLRFYSEKLGIPGVQVVRTPKIALKKSSQIGVVSFDRLAHFFS